MIIGLNRWSKWRFFGCFACLLLSLSGWGDVALAQRKLEPKLVTPKPTTRPPQMEPEEVIRPLGCIRKATLDGDLIPCDSFHKKNGEKLRPLFQDTPKALEALNRYQSTRDRADWGIYTGSLGVFMALGGWIASTQITDPQLSNQIRSIGIVGGLSLTAGSVVFSLITLNAAEAHLADAVTAFNDAHPKKPLSVIEIKTRILF